jgi:hypothetical protein
MGISADGAEEDDLEETTAETTPAGTVVRDQVKHYLFINRDFLQQ